MATQTEKKQITDDIKAEEKKPIPSIQTKKVKKKKKKKIWLIFFIGVLILGAIGFFFRKPINNSLAKVTQNIPILNKVFKSVEDPYANTTKNELINTVEESKNESESLKKALEDKQNEIEALNQKIQALKQYEDRYLAFEEQKKAWDENIARANPTLFIQQYEAMYPETAEALYKELVSNVALTKTQKEFSLTIGEMDETQAAKALEQLVPTDNELIKLIFDGMESERKSLILSAMDSKVAAQVIKILSPDIPTNLNGGK